MASKLSGSTLGRKSAPQEEEDDLDITPMIDVTFLLLIFFMVTSNMQKSDPLEIPPARHGIGVPMDQSSVISIYNIDGEPEIHIETDIDEGAVSLERVTEFVAANIVENKLKVIIKADRNLPTGFVEEVARAANKAADGVQELEFYVGVIDKPGG